MKRDDIYSVLRLDYWESREGENDIKPVRGKIGKISIVLPKGKGVRIKERLETRRARRSWRSLRYLKVAKKCRKTDRCHSYLTLRLLRVPLPPRLPTVHRERRKAKGEGGGKKQAQAQINPCQRLFQRHRYSILYTLYSK